MTVRVAIDRLTVNVPAGTRDRDVPLYVARALQHELAAHEAMRVVPPAAVRHIGRSVATEVTKRCG